jgi:hypothetical protein
VGDPVGVAEAGGAAVDWVLAATGALGLVNLFKVQWE